MKLPKGPKRIPKKPPPPRPPPFTPRPPAPSAPISKPSLPKKGFDAHPTAPKPVQTPNPLAYREPAPPPRTERTLEEWEALEWEAFEQKTRVNRWRQWPLLMCGLAAFGIGVYSVQLWISLNNTPPPEDVPHDLSDRFDKEAGGYDEKVNTAEILLMLNSKRKTIMKRANGHVLEVAVGTGRNTAYYPTKKCSTVTLLDSSGPMMAVAKRKWKDTHPEYFSRVFFKQQSALDPITPPYGAQDGYDTVIETMGLCSTPEPEKLLRNLGAATKEDGGQILLLEHGKSHYDWLNNILDKTAPAHANEHGCWWNKDIGKIVEDSGLEVVKIKRYNFGTTWWVELKPKKGTREKLLSVKQEEPRVPLENKIGTQKSWWSFWS